MLTLTKRTDYALIALCHLAKTPARIVSARDVATESGVPLPMLTNILKGLSHAGLVISERGSRGGYALARPAKAISLYELIEALEGPVNLVRCINDDTGDATGTCELEHSCPVRGPARQVLDRFRGFLKGVSLADLGVSESDDQGLTQLAVVHEKNGAS